MIRFRATGDAGARALGLRGRRMTMERWGTLSVKDHLDANALVSDLLLYDRLVVPVFTGEGERTRWRNESWGPELQERYIQLLGDLVVKAPWDAERQQRFADLRRATRQIAADAFQATRMLLAMDQRLDRPPGADVRVVAAFHTRKECRDEMKITADVQTRDSEGRLGFLLGQRILVPLLDRRDPMETVKVAADLSREPAFRDRRRTFYEWQEQAVDKVVLGRQSIDGAVVEMQQLIRDLNDASRARVKKLLAKSVFTVVQAALPFVLGITPLGLVAAIPGAFDLVKFAAFDAGEQPASGKSEAAAMFLLARKKLAPLRRGYAPAS